MNKNKYTAYKNSYAAVKAVFRRNLIALNTYIKNKASNNDLRKLEIRKRRALRQHTERNPKFLTYIWSLPSYDRTNLLKDIPNPAKYQPSAIKDVCPQSPDLINTVGSTWQRH